jgi:hypothetical protein
LWAILFEYFDRLKNWTCTCEQTCCSASAVLADIFLVYNNILAERHVLNYSNEITKPLRLPWHLRNASESRQRQSTQVIHAARNTLRTAAPALLISPLSFA